jgi:tetratricopeptide (TPR) repeat protein
MGRIGTAYLASKPKPSLEIGVSFSPSHRKFATAQAKFEQAMHLNPNFAEAHNNLGSTLGEQGPQNYTKSLQHYNQAIKLKPDMAETYEYRGVLFAKIGRRADVPVNSSLLGLSCRTNRLTLLFLSPVGSPTT